MTKKQLLNQLEYLADEVSVGNIGGAMYILDKIREQVESIVVDPYEELGVM